MRTRRRGGHVVIEDWIQAHKPFEFGQLTVSFEGDVAVIGVRALNPGPSPSALGEGGVDSNLRQGLREWVRADDAGRYRPLPGALTMRAGWEVRCPPKDVIELLDEVYPLGARHMEQRAHGELRVVGLDVVLGRQTGRYKVASELDARGRRVAQRVLCGRCVKAPVWGGEEPAAGQVPCPEPCSVMVALCREAALWQQSSPERAPGDPDVSFAAFDVAGNEVREEYLSAIAGEFAGR